MTLSRTFRRILGVVSIAALLTAGLIAPPAQGGGAGTRVVFDCDIAAPLGTTTLTLAVGQQFSIVNRGVGGTCRLFDFTVGGSTASRPSNQGLINATNLAGASFAQVPSGQTSLVTLIEHGNFRVRGGHRRRDSPDCHHARQGISQERNWNGADCCKSCFQRQWG